MSFFNWIFCALSIHKLWNLLQFDAVAYINRVFPTEQSLSGVESAVARCEFRLSGVEQDIRRLVRAQAEQREAGQEALTEAQRCIAELALQVITWIRKEKFWFRISYNIFI